MFQALHRCWILAVELLLYADLPCVVPSPGGSRSGSVRYIQDQTKDTTRSGGWQFVQCHGARVGRPLLLLKV